MASTNDIAVSFQIEPIVKLKCLRLGCRHNLVNTAMCGEIHCALKYVVITEEGKCGCFETLKEDRRSYTEIHNG